jgi:hypothetical protein
LVKKQSSHFARLFFFCGLLWVAACQRELDWDRLPPAAPPPVPYVLPDSATLVKLAYLDTSRTAPYDSTAIYNITYNSRNKPTGFLLYIYRNGVQSPVLRAHYFYNGADTLPAHIQSQFYVSNGINVENKYIEYDNQGRVAKDSIVIRRINDTEITIYRYNYTNPQRIWTDVKVYMLSNPSNFSPGLYQRSDLVRNGDLIIQQKDTTNFSTQWHQFEATYDQHPNPLQPAFNAPYQTMIYSQSYIVGESQKNNITTHREQIYDDNGALLGNYLIQYNYRYRSNGYPAEATMDFAGTANGPNKVLYFYRR